MRVPSDIKALLETAKRQLQEIRSTHQASLGGQPVPESLGVTAKNQLENLRSALDYLAGHIRRLCCPQAKGRHYYFPLTYSRKKFEAHTKRDFPHLRQRCPEVWQYLERVQPYPQRGPSMRSLRHLHRISNIAKHHGLIPLRRREVPLGDPRAAKLGPAVYRLQEPSRPEPDRDVWVDFVFRGADISAVWLPEGALGHVRSIVDDVCYVLPD